MNKKIIIALSSILVVFALSWSSCSKTNGPTTEEFVIAIDSIIHADTITVGGTLSIKFYGLVGPNGCYAFDRLSPEYLQVTDTTGELKITSYGIHTFNDVCPDNEVYMNGTELVVSDIPLGKLEIKAMQPDGTALSQFVIVKQ